MDVLKKRVGWLVVVVLAVLLIPVTNKAQAATAPVLKSLGQITDGILAPTRLDVDAAGVLYVCDPRRNAVLRFDKYGRSLAPLAGEYRVGGTGVAVTPDGKTVYVSVASGVDARGTKIITGVAVLDAKTGVLLGYLGENGLAEFQRAGEVDLDDQGLVYVADEISRFVRVYNPATRQLLYQFGGAGTGEGQFWSIRSMTVDTVAQEVYVIDPSTNSGTTRIQVFGLSGQYNRLIAQTGMGTPTLAFPQGLAFDNFGRGYLLDGFYSDLRVFGVPGTYLSKYGTAGSAAGQLSRPYDVAYDAGTKRLFIGCDGGRVEIVGVDDGSTPIKGNSLPGLAEPLSPVADSEVTSATPQLLWKNAVDEDGDSLSYNVRVQQNGQIVAQANGVVSAAINGSVQVAAVLAENKFHSWQVQANDGLAVSAWSSAQGFWVNAVEEAPTAPVIVAPAVDVVLDGAGVFTWQASTDMDPFDIISYRFEIAASSDFIEPLIVVEDGATMTAALKTLAGYDKLVDGSTYYWRVTAVDNHGVTSSVGEVRNFVYDTTILKITANMPGTRVYLGGNYAFSGRYVGEAPIELRDVAVGVTSVVFERSGFSPWVGQAAVLNERANTTIVGTMVPAVQPIGHKASPVFASGSPIVGGVEIVPVAVDYDNDGLIDLLTADAAGSVTLYNGIVATKQPAFGSGVKLGLTLPAGAAPSVVDWNNDGKKDLLVGTAGGSVLLYLNVGSETLPAYTDSSILNADGAPIYAGNNAVPSAFDFDGDGKKDLIVGSGNGTVLKFHNTGSDSSPELTSAGMLIPGISGNTAPFVTDWDGDGVKDLLVATDRNVLIYLRQADGSYAPQGALAVEGTQIIRLGKVVGGTGYLGNRLRIFAYDVVGKNGKDLIIGNAAGQVRLVASAGTVRVAAYLPAVVDKIEQVAALAKADGKDLTVALARIQALVSTGKYYGARTLALSLKASFPAASATSTALSELAGII